MEIYGIEIEVEYKPIKNIHLAVYPPDARVHVSAPDFLRDDDIRIYLISKMDWIKSKREAVRAQPRQTPREYVSGENHYFLGRRYLLRVSEKEAKPEVYAHGDFIDMTVRPGATLAKKEEVMREWYRERLQEVLSEYVAKWAAIMGAGELTWQIKIMKDCWGSCNASRRRILFNLELARVPRQCIEYVVVHELVHLWHRLHNKAFTSTLETYLPNWKTLREELNNFTASYLKEYGS